MQRKYFFLIFFLLAIMLATINAGIASLFNLVGYPYYFIDIPFLNTLFDIVLYSLPVALPFLMLAGLSALKRIDEQPRYGTYALWFSALGAFIAIAGTMFMMWVAILIGEGPETNFYLPSSALAIGTMICAMPVLVITAMSIGWSTGVVYDVRKSISDAENLGG